MIYEEKRSGLESLIQRSASEIKEFWFDVDGVMTPQGQVTIYDVVSDIPGRCFERKDGIDSIRLVPCDENGKPLENVVEYIAGTTGEPIMEGYRFDPRDGKVIEYAVANKYPVYFVSGRNSPCVKKRALVLGARSFLGEKDKLAIIKKHSQVSLSNILFIGDGIQDCEAMGQAGLSIAPADACEEALAIAHGITSSRGGEGVIAEVLAVFLKAQDMWPTN
jgi:3-deoxy-D-manno-octulosonate 8-phosphate phosphatase (KDO 8-P phosphatase)